MGPLEVLIILIVLGFVALVVRALLALGRTGKPASSRPCPHCNSPVPTGQTRCEACGYDFTK